MKWYVCPKCGADLLLISVHTNELGYPLGQDGVVDFHDLVVDGDLGESSEYLECRGDERHRYVCEYTVDEKDDSLFRLSAGASLAVEDQDENKQ